MKLTSLIVILFLACFGGFIGFSYDSTAGSVTASNPPIYLPELVKPNFDPLNLDVNLETGQLSVNNAINGKVNVNIEHKAVETPPEYITKIKEVYIENTIRSAQLLNKLMPLEKPTFKWPGDTGSRGVNP